MNFDDQISLLTNITTNSAMKDENWRTFGFKGRPKRGLVFNRFINKSTLAAEKFMFKEMILLSIIDVIEAIKHKNLPDDIKFMLILSVLAKTFIPLFHAEIFNNSTELIKFIQTGYEEYSSNLDALLVRTKEYIEEYKLDNNTSNKLFSGAVELGSSICIDSDFKGFLKDRELIASKGIQIENLTEKPKFPLPDHDFDIFASFAMFFLESSQ